MYVYMYDKVFLALKRPHNYKGTLENVISVVLYMYIHT